MSGAILRTLSVPWHPVWKSLRQRPFCSGWGGRGLPRATKLMKGQVHPRTQVSCLCASCSWELCWKKCGTPRSSGGPMTVLTLSRYGTRWETTSTWWGCSPTSSWASRRAVAVSSMSTGSLFPPGKQTSPGALRSWGIERRVTKWGFNLRTI